MRLILAWCFLVFPAEIYLFFYHTICAFALTVKKDKSNNLKSNGPKNSKSIIKKTIINYIICRLPNIK